MLEQLQKCQEFQGDCSLARTYTQFPYTKSDKIRDERSASLNHDCAERPDVTLRRVSAMKQQRRASPRRSSDLGECICCHAVQHFPQTKVCNLAPPSTRQQNIWALDVQVSYGLLVQRQEASSNVQNYLLAPVWHMSHEIRSFTALDRIQWLR